MKKTFLSAILFLSFLSTLQAQTADEIIGKFVTAIGGIEKCLAIQSMRTEGYSLSSNGKINFIMQQVNLKGVRVDAWQGKTKYLDIVTPDKAWSQNPLMGDTAPRLLSIEELKYKLDALDIGDNLLEYKKQGTYVEWLGKSKDNGNEYYKIRKRTKNDIETLYYFNSQSSLIDKTETTVMRNRRKIKTVTKLSNYRTTDGDIRMAYKAEEANIIYIITKIIINPPVDESIFTIN